MSTVPRSLLLSTFLTITPVTIGVAVSQEPSPRQEVAPYAATPLADVDTTAAVVTRAQFCDLVPAEATVAALGVEATGTAYDNGDESDLLPDGDVAHEYGCRFVPTSATSTGSEARAWVFAPPVTTARAEALAEAATTARRCDPVDDAAAFGAPSVALVCAGDGLRTASYRGLFGDAWLTCSLTLPSSTPAAELADRADRWCAAVVVAASA